MNFTEEEIEFMQRLRTKKMGYGNIARRLEAVYRKKPTVSQVKRALATPEQKQANTEIAAMSLPKSLKQVVKLRESGATYKQITEKTGFSYPKVKSICDVFVANNSDISKSNMSRYRAEAKKAKKKSPEKRFLNPWTDKEMSELVSLKHQNLTWREISEKLGRSLRACEQKYYSLRKMNSVLFIETKEPVPVKTESVEVTEKKWANNRCNYSPQDELEIMVDFPNLSIDEMRKKYQRDYRALAGRYEDIWDSEEPSRIAIVMEASRIVAARKAEEEQKQTEPRMGWFERRRMKRVARKAAKIQKRLDKMATKYGAILTNGDE